MNIVALSGRLAGLPRLTYTKNGKPQTGFHLIVPNDDSPGYFTRESVLLVGRWAEHSAEKLDAGAEVELSGKLQRGQVVCFRVRLRFSHSPPDESAAAPEGDSSEGEIVASDGSQEVAWTKKGQAHYPKLLQQPWTPSPN